MSKKSHARALTPEIVACALTFTKREVRLLTGVQDGVIERCVKDGPQGPLAQHSEQPRPLSSVSRR